MQVSGKNLALSRNTSSLCIMTNTLARWWRNKYMEISRHHQNLTDTARVQHKSKPTKQNNNLENLTCFSEWLVDVGRTPERKISVLS